MNFKESMQKLFEDEELTNYKPKRPRFWQIVRNFIICCAITDMLMIGYIEFGHDRGWKRADAWYTCIHTHNHFPWQK